MGKTAAMVVFILWFMFTKPGKRVIVACPQDNQVQLIFRELRRFIDVSADLSESVKKSTQDPHHISFHNGSTVSGFSTGTSSGSKAMGIRGQGGDLIILDEADFMSEDDLTTVLALMMEDPKNIRIVMSSTPTGKRDIFWRACTDRDMGYSEFHFPAMMSPNWGPEMEKELRNTFLGEAYTHEVLAEFGEETAGVFNKTHIDRACSHELYTYRQLYANELTEAAIRGVKIQQIGNYTLQKRAPKGIRTIGVDFDKYGAGTQIVVIEYQQSHNKLVTVYREEIPRGEDTYDRAVQKVAQLNQIYSPFRITVDRGAGEYQLERLRKVGQNKDELIYELSNRVSGVHFSQNVQVSDPVTGEISNKPFKPFIIGMAQTLFERDQVIMSPYDDVMRTEFLNLRVIRRSQTTGMPVFSDSNDHTIAAWLLSIYPFVCERPELLEAIHEFEPETGIALSSKSLDWKRQKSVFDRLNSQFTRPQQEVDPLEPLLPGQELIRVDPVDFYKVRDENRWARGKAQPRSRRSW